MSRRQSSRSPWARMMCATSAPSYRSRSITNAFDQMLSSAGATITVTPTTSRSLACSNQPSSTTATPLPELKITSINPLDVRTLASQWEKTRSAS
jgi:hypothetical protein